MQKAKIEREEVSFYFKQFPFPNYISPSAFSYIQNLSFLILYFSFFLSYIAFKDSDKD